MQTLNPFIRVEGDLMGLHFQEEEVQSLMDKTRPDELVLDYTKVMMCFLNHNPSPERIGIIGLGGGSIPKYCYRNLPSSQVSVAEISPEVIALRSKFQIPDDDERLQVYLEDGADFVARHRRVFDVLLVDGFDAKGQPPQLWTERFYIDCYQALTPDGMLVVNPCDWGYQSAYARMRRVFFHQTTLSKCSDGTNRIAFATKIDLLTLVRGTSLS